MSNLSTLSLGDLIEFQRGYDLPKSEFKSGNVPVISSNGILGYHNEVKVKAPGITIGRSGTVGLPHFIEEDFFPHNTSLYVKDFKNNDPKYIFYLLKTLKLNDKKSGSGVPTMNRNHLHPLKIKAYSKKAEQQKVAKVLSSLDSKIELNNKINKQLEAMAKTLYDYWFVQFDFPDENGKPYKSSGGKMVYNQELKREIPQGWEVKIISQLLNVITGKEDANFAVENGKYPFFTCSETIFSCDEYAFEGKAILIAGNGNFNVKLYEGKFNAYQRTYVLIPNDEKHYSVIFYAVKDQLKKLSNSSAGSIIKFITKGDVDNIPLVLPLIGNNELFIKLNNITVLLEKNIEQNQELVKLRDWLLPMLMNGQVRVK